MNPLLNAALKYADNGWNVFPLFGIVDGRCECGTKCGSPGKHPRTARGFYDATTEFDQIERWWEAWPHANIGIRTGKESNLWVIDVDNKKSVDIGGGGLVGLGDHALRQLALEGVEVPDTLVQITGSGGRHLCFAYPGGAGVDFPNRSGVLPGIDIRGDGGYVVVAPSLGVSGAQYRWVEADRSPVLPTSVLLDRLARSAEGDRSSPELDLDPNFVINEGEGRHEWLFKMGAKLRGEHALGYVALYGALQAYNAQVLRPSLEAREVEHIVQSCMKYPAERSAPIDQSEWAEDVPDLDDGEDLAPDLFEFLMNEPPAMLPLVGGVFNSGEAMIVAGPPNVGKTWLMLDMMLGIATGTHFANHFRCAQAGVLFIDEEGSHRGQWERLSKLVAGREMSAVGVPMYPKIGAGIKIDSEKGITAIRRLIERYRPGVVVMDSLVRMHGGEESSNREMARFFEVVKLFQRNYDISIVFTHHIRKPSKETANDLIYMLRGASDIQGFPDSILMAMPGDDSTEIKAHHTKMRNDRKLPPFSFQVFVDDERGEAKVGVINDEPLHVPGMKANPSRDAIVRAIVEAGGEATAASISIATGLGIRTVIQNLDVLKKSGYVMTDKTDDGTDFRYLWRDQ